jgi:hypothetical protein
LRLQAADVGREDRRDQRVDAGLHTRGPADRLELADLRAQLPGVGEGFGSERAERRGTGGGARELAGDGAAGAYDAGRRVPPASSSTARGSVAGWRAAAACPLGAAGPGPRGAAGPSGRGLAGRGRWRRGRRRVRPVLRPAAARASGRRPRARRHF